MAGAGVGAGAGTGGGGGAGSDAATTTPGGRRLSELRVTELRLELERRGLERHGVKALLVDRLHQALKDEGLDSEEYIFDSDADKKISTKKSTPPDGASEEETMEDVNLDNLVVKDELSDEDSNTGTSENAPVSKTDKPTANVPSAKTGDSQQVREGTVSVIRKREASVGEEKSQAKKPCRENKDINGIDGEDSINLDIGEEDFLNEDGEAGSNVHKDVKMEAQGAAADAPSAQQKSGENKQQAAERENVPAEPPSVRVEKDLAPSSEVSAADDPKNNSTLASSEQDKNDNDPKKGSPQSSASSSRNLWVSGLSSSTRAKDLKQLCSAHGKVIGAKIVINARTPGSRCYGYITMANGEDALKCIKYLHRTELHGRMISMEKAKSESLTGAGNYPPGSSPNSKTQRSPRRSNTIREKIISTPTVEKKKEPPIKKEKESVAKSVEVKESDVKKDEENSGEVSATENDGSKQGSIKTKRDRTRPRTQSTKDFLSFSKIKKEREAQRSRDLVRRARSEERRRHAAERSLRELESRHRDEKHRQRVEKERLALEREKIRIEREKIEREKHELQRIERERQKLERERLEMERMELKRAQIRLEEERERAATKRSYIYASSGGGASGLLPRSKELLPPPPPSTYERSSGRGGDSGISSSSRYPHSTHLNAPPPTYEMSAGSSSSGKPVDRGPSQRERPRERERARDFKRDYPPPAPRSSHTGNISSSGFKYSSNGSSYESRQPLPPGTRARDQRYLDNDVRGNAGGNRSGGGTGHDRSSSSNYRPSDSSRRSPKPPSRDSRYSDSGISMKGDSWTSSSVGDGGGRYGTSSANSGQYDSRYGSYQPTPPGSNSYPDAVSYPVQRDFRQKY